MAETTATLKFVVFTSNPSWSVYAGIAEIAQSLTSAEFLVVVDAPPRRLGTLLRNQWRNIRRNGLRWVPYQVDDLRRRLTRRHDQPIPPGMPGYARTLSSLGDRVRIVKVADIHSGATLDAVRNFEPDVGLSLAAPILRRSLFSIPKRGTLNLHKGRVPDYRGMPAAFWELWNNETSVGCTIHWLDDKLDTGDVVAEAELPRDQYSTLRGMQLGLDEIGIKLMRQAVLDVVGWRVQARPQSAGGRTYRKPTLAQVADLNRRLAGPPTHESAIRHGLKEVFFLGGMSLGYGPLRVALSPRITVLLYHRVSDAVRDNLTVGIEEFDWQMQMLRERCVVRSIEEVLSMHRVPASSKPQVCITFDDGYLDNYVNAVPILERYGLTAAFFVSTGIVGTSRPFPHDLRRGRVMPTMTWDQLRDMHGRGFTIGSHSVSHIDCAAEPEGVVADELRQSLADITREIGVEQVIFAYPYGGREHMSAQRLSLVRATGFVGCLSAYGGSNVGTIDPFNIRRCNVHWEFSRRAFLFQCSGLK